jgi:uncharacterized protein YndB with AHSA1/START domain
MKTIQTGWSFFISKKKSQSTLHLTFSTTDLFVVVFKFVSDNNRLKNIFMNTGEKGKAITVQTTIKAPLSKVWKLWSEPQHIIRWNNASDEWHTPSAKNDFVPNGRFVYRMEAKDGSFGFDFSGVYDEIKDKQQINYTIDDGRKVAVNFTASGDETLVVQTFEAEEINSSELQQQGWQAILDNFKRYAESN